MVDAYRRRVARLAKVALEPTESRDLIADIAREFELAGAMHNAPCMGHRIVASA